MQRVWSGFENWTNDFLSTRLLSLGVNIEMTTSTKDVCQLTSSETPSVVRVAHAAEQRGIVLLQGFIIPLKLLLFLSYYMIPHRATGIYLYAIESLAMAHHSSASVSKEVTPFLFGLQVYLL